MSSKIKENNSVNEFIDRTLSAYDEAGDFYKETMKKKFVETFSIPDHSDKVFMMKIWVGHYWIEGKPLEFEYCEQMIKSYNNNIRNKYIQYSLEKEMGLKKIIHKVKDQDNTYLGLSIQRELNDLRDKLVLIIISYNCKSGQLKSKYEPLAKQCCMTKSLFSRHLGNLKRIGLVSTRKIFNEDGKLDHYIFNIKL